MSFFYSELDMVLADLWSNTDWEEVEGLNNILNLVEPVSHLTQDNVSKLLDHPYVVGPKADGERALLIGRWFTSEVLLLNMRGSLKRIEGAFAETLRGFILDIEVVDGPGGSKLFLSFDVLAVHPQINLSSWPKDKKDSLRKKLNVRTLRSYEQLNIKVAYQERREILSEIVESISMAGLLVKPIADAMDAPKVWALAQKLPYPVDGLVFTPCYHGPVNYKWKPPQQLTLDVALGNELEQNDDRSLFRAHIFIPHSGHHWKNMDNLNSAQEDHVPFCFNTKSQSYPFSENEDASSLAINVNVGDDDIAFADYKDMLAIKKEREIEMSNFHLYSQACHNSNCPCGELFVSGKKLLHCSLCGVLCVSHEENVITCACYCGTVEVEQPKTRPSESGSYIWVPRPDREWASFKIVEVNFDLSGELQFKRLRHDRQVANSMEVANEIFRAKEKPICFDDLANLLKHPVESSSVSRSTLFDSYRASSSSEKQSSFSALRCMHSNIKKWLYVTFGGDRIIDACAGGLNDLNNWKASGCSNVLALEWDTELVQRGREQLSMFNQRIKVDLIKVDLSRPLKRDIGADYRHKSAAVFCNFGLHYFWESPSKTNQFLTNLVPFLSNGGHFVATVMSGDAFASTSSVRIINDNGGIEFEAIKHDDDTADVFIASIGKTHRESIIDEAVAKVRFAKVGLEHVGTYPFTDLAQMYPSVDLPKEETKMSSLYTTYVFVMRADNTASIRGSESSVFNFPKDVERDILLYLHVGDLVSKVRGLSRAARRIVDTLNIPNTTAWFGSRPSKVTLSDMAQSPSQWPPASVGLFLRFGGKVDDGSPNDLSSWIASLDDHNWYHHDDYSDGGYDMHGNNRYHYY